MTAIAQEGFDFPRWMNELDAESRARLDRFLDMTAEALANATPQPRNRVAPQGQTRLPA
jgi:hypothetical protein